MKPLYIGRSVFAQRGAAQDRAGAMYHFGTQNQLIALMGGIDIAAHDAMGKLLNLSVADLIGGRQRDACRSMPRAAISPKQTTRMQRWHAQLEPNAARGFAAFKIKIGRHPAEDAARALARRIIGDTPLLTVDTNGNYTEDGVLEEHAPHRAFRHPLVPRNHSRRRTGPATRSLSPAHRCHWRPARRCTACLTSAG